MGSNIASEKSLPPVTYLMCNDIKMSSILVDKEALHTREIPLFLSLLHHVITRWHTAIGKLNEWVYEGYNENIGTLHNMENLFSSIMECDTEEVFNERKKLYKVVQDFNSMVEGYAEVFTGPPELKNFYFNIIHRIDSTLETVLEGKNGW